MTKAKWLRIAALCALVALGFHGAAALAHQHDSGAERDCAQCHFGHVHGIAPESPDHRPLLPAAACAAAQPARAADQAARSLPPSRGPPA